MRELLEQLLRAADAPNRERAQLLWDEYRNGGPDANAAFTTLLAWYGNALYRRIWGFVRSDAAEDVLQNVLKKLHENRRNAGLADFHSEVMPWLRTIADNECVTHHRRKTLQRRNEPKAARSEIDTDAVERRELQLVLADALSQLKPEQRDAIALHFFEGMARQDAAAELKIDRKTFANRLNDGLARLQQLLPAKAVLPVGAVGVPTALSAVPPPLSATRLGELIAAAWVKASASGWSVGRVATVVLVGLTLCGGAAAAGWALTREQPEPPKPVGKVTDTPGLPEPQESVPDRNRRIFQTEVLPRQLAALRALVIGDGEVVLVSVTSQNTRVHCVYDLRHEPGAAAWPSFRVEFVHNVVGRSTHLDLDLTGKGKGRRLDPTRALVIGRNPLTGTDLVLKSEPLQRAVAAFDALPSDEQTAAEARADLPRLKRSLESFLGRWYLKGDPARRVDHNWVRDGTLATVVQIHHGGVEVEATHLWVDTTGRAHGLPYTLGPARLSADGQRLDIDGTDDWWSREPATAPGK